MGSITAREEKWVNPTMQSDIYSLAMVVIEVTYRLHASYVQVLTRFAFCSKVFTGKVPFPNATNVHVVIMISRGERPQKPPGGEALGLGPALWRLTEECWNPNPERRPDSDNVLRRFQAIGDTGLWTVFSNKKRRSYDTGPNRWRRDLFITSPKALRTAWSK